MAVKQEVTEQVHFGKSLDRAEHRLLNPEDSIGDHSIFISVLRINMQKDNLSLSSDFHQPYCQLSSTKTEIPPEFGESDIGAAIDSESPM